MELVVYCTLVCDSYLTLQEFQSFLPKMTRSVISAQILVLVSMRKYILNHKEISNTIDSKIILHNYILY